MTRNTVDKQRLIKKGEAARLLGFGNTAGYKYLDFLAMHKILLPVFLPGIKSPRYIKSEVEEMPDREVVKVPDFNVKN